MRPCGASALPSSAGTALRACGPGAVRGFGPSSLRPCARATSRAQGPAAAGLHEGRAASSSDSTGLSMQRRRPSRPKRAAAERAQAFTRAVPQAPTGTGNRESRGARSSSVTLLRPCRAADLWLCVGTGGRPFAAARTRAQGPFPLRTCLPESAQACRKTGLQLQVRTITRCTRRMYTCPVPGEGASFPPSPATCG